METYSVAHRIKVKSRIAILNLLKMRNARRYLNKDSCQIVVQGLVISHLDYCNSIRIGIPDDTLKHFERIQVISAKTLRLVKLTWNCISYQLKSEINIAHNIAHKALYGLAIQVYYRFPYFQTSKSWRLESNQDKMTLIVARTFKKSSPNVHSVCKDHWTGTHYQENWG